MKRIVLLIGFVLGGVVEWNAHPPSTKEEKKQKVTNCKNSYNKILPSQGMWQYHIMQVASHSLLNASPHPLVKKIQIKLHLFGRPHVVHKVTFK
jgi:hypothetical protein